MTKGWVIRASFFAIFFLSDPFKLKGSLLIFPFMPHVPEKIILANYFDTCKPKHILPISLTAKWNLWILLRRSEQENLLIVICQPCPQRILLLSEKSEKEVLKHLKHIINVYQNRGHVFQNKLRNTKAAMLEILADLRLEILSFST